MAVRCSHGSARRLMPEAVSSLRASSLAPIVASGAGLLLLGLTLLLVASGTLAVWVIPAAVLGGLIISAIRLGPLATLALVLGLQAFQPSGKDGTQPGEIVAAIAFVGYLAVWYASAVSSPRKCVTSGFDAVAVGYGTVGFVVACMLGYGYGADPFDFRADVLAFLPFVFYLPIKEAVARHQRGAITIAVVLVGFGLLTTVQSFLMLRAIIAGAVEFWEVADVRFASTETAITSGLLFCFAGFAVAPRFWQKLLLLASVGVLLGGLILTKSRGFWVAGVLGLLVAFILSTSAQRKQLAIGTVLGLGVLLVVTLSLFSDGLLLLAAGTLKRLTLSQVPPRRTYRW